MTAAKPLRALLERHPPPEGRLWSGERSNQAVESIAYRPRGRSSTATPRPKISIEATPRFDTMNYHSTGQFELFNMANGRFLPTPQF
jgi:hypothetical protein